MRFRLQLASMMEQPFHITRYNVVNIHYISDKQDLVTKYGPAICSLCSKIEFKFKCAVGLLGYFAGTFSGYYICLDLALRVNYSSALYLLSHLCSRLYRSVPRGNP